MNELLFQKILSKLNDNNKLTFITNIKAIILNDNMLEQTSCKIGNINLTFNSLVIIANYINENEFNLELSKKIKYIQNQKLFFLVYIRLTEEEKTIKRQIFDNLYKEYYDLCQKYNWNEQTLNELKIKSKLLEDTSLTINEEIILSEIKTQEIFEYANYYSKTFMNKNRGREIRKLMNTKEYIFFNMILNNEKIDNIVEFANKYIDKKRLDVLLDNFIKDYSLVENIESLSILNEIRSTITTKISTINFDTVKNNTPVIENNELEQALKIINLFIDGNYRNIKHFCKATSLSVSKFKSYVLLISQTNKELFEKYCLTVKMHENKRNLSNDEIVNLLIKYIKNGMLKNGVLNEFNLNDYYNTINIQFEFLIEIIDSNKTLNQNDLELIKEFLNKCNIKMKSL